MKVFLKMANNFKKTIITTPIYYPNANLHIGHAYTNTLADVLARFRRLEGKQVFFTTGSDEHGQKLLDKAKEQQQDVYEYVSEIVDNFKLLWNKLDISYDVFVRTTDKNHIEKVQNIFTKFFEKDLIYKGFYQGFYCKSDESYFTKFQLNDGKCPICGREVELFEQESYFLRIKQFKKWIKNELKNTDMLYPKFRVNELLNSFIDANLEDLSISRQNFSWGVQIKEDKAHVVYVWFDALINYLSMFSYEQAPLKEDAWNQEDTEIVQFLGKEIIRFHAIYWPIILKNLGMKMPKLLAHGWLVVDGEKMSKSLGNIVDPLQIIEDYSSDALRYYLISKISFGSDGKFSQDDFKEHYNAILVNKYSNLINRTLKMNEKYFTCKVPNKIIKMDLTKNTVKAINQIELKIMQAMQIYDFNTYNDLLINYLDYLNGYIDKSEPWKETNANNREEIISFLLEKIYSLSLLFNPIIPSATKKIMNLYKEDNHTFNNLIIDVSGQKFPASMHLFERRK